MTYADKENHGNNRVSSSNSELEIFAHTRDIGLGPTMLALLELCLKDQRTLPKLALSIKAHRYKTASMHVNRTSTRRRILLSLFGSSSSEPSRACSMGKSWETLLGSWISLSFVASKSGREASYSRSECTVWPSRLDLSDILGTVMSLRCGDSILLLSYRHEQQ